MDARITRLAGWSLALAVVAPAAASPAAIKQQILEYPAGSCLHVTSMADGRTVDYTRASDGTWQGIEVVATSPSAGEVQGVSYTTAGLAVHSITDGTSNTIMFGLFRSGAGTVANPPFVLRDPRTNETTAPAAVRTITLDPGRPDSVLVDAGHVVTRTGTYRGLALALRTTGELVLADFDFSGQAVRRTSLGFTPPIGSNKGSFTATPDGHVWVALASARNIRLLDLGDLSATGPLAPVQSSALTLGERFDPESTRVGIIAILIGLLRQPKPSVSYQVGDELFIHGLKNGELELVARQKVPEGASGLIEEDGAYWYLLPYIEQENLYRGFPGFVAVPFGTIAY